MVPTSDRSRLPVMDGGFVATIADVARRRPDAVAVVLEDDQLT